MTQVLDRYGVDLELGRLDGSRRGPRGAPARDADALRRDADQPDDGDHRHRRRSPSSRTPSGAAARGRQHLHVALLPAAARARRRRRRPLDDQVPERPLRLDRRRSRREVGRGTRSGSTSSRTSAGAILSPFDSFLVAARHQDAGVRMDRHEDERARAGRAASTATPRSRAVFYPGLPDHPGHATQQGARPPASARWSRSSSAAYDAAKRFLDRVEVCRSPRAWAASRR